MFELTGKTAIVTGVSRGIGEAIAKGFVQAGAALYLASDTSGYVISQTLFVDGGRLAL